MNRVIKIFSRFIKCHLEYIQIGRKCCFTKDKIVCSLYLYVEANPEGKRLFGRHRRR
jgi:hypothetical protein